MYSRETLAKYIDIALNADVANGMVAELMSELEQIPVKVEIEGMSPAEAKEELNRNLPDYLPDMLEDDEVYTENPKYKTEARDFNIYDSTGKVMLTVSPDRTIDGHGALTFTVPFSSPEDKEAFLDFCDRLQKKSAVKYPKSEE